MYIIKIHILCGFKNVQHYLIDSPVSVSTMDIDYEYESLSDSEEEAVGRESFWGEMTKRIKCQSNQVHIYMEDNDDTSVIDNIIETIRTGVSAQAIACQCQIENIHNAIVNHPSKGTGPQRLNDIARLQSLIRPDLNLTHVTHIHIPNAEDYRSKHVRAWAMLMPNLVLLSLSSPKTDMLQKLHRFRRLQHLRIDNVDILPGFYIGKNLEVLTLSRIRRFRDSGTILFIQRVRIDVQNSTLDESDCIVLKTHGNVTYTDVHVDMGNGILKHEEWLKTINSKFTF